MQFGKESFYPITNQGREGDYNMKVKNIDKVPLIVGGIKMESGTNKKYRRYSLSSSRAIVRVKQFKNKISQGVFSENKCI